MSYPHERLAAFLKVREWNQGEAAERFGCSQAMVSWVLSGTKLPGRLLANRIEAVTSERPKWGGGPVRSEEWDALELARRASRDAEDAA
jgi:transcriptional regulator with XRE-family HTH domain